MKFIYTLIPLLFLTNPLFSLNTEIDIGGASGWDTIESRSNIESYQGKGGYNSLGLRSAEYAVDKNTDLLLHFDNPLIIDASSHYRVEANIETTHLKKVMGRGSGVFRGKGESISLYPGNKSIFSGGRVLDNFSIEFWLNPSRFNENQIILSYQGTIKNKEGNLVPQELTCIMKARKLIWNMENIFYMNGEETNIQLTGITSIIPDVWHHHLLRFNGTSGIIEYLVDGRLEAVQYASKTGTEDGTIYFPLFSSNNPDLTLGKDFIGYMDEFRISRSFIVSPGLYQYQGMSGVAESQTIDLGRADSRLQKIKIESEIPGDSAIFFQYNISDSLEDMFEENKWIDFSPSDIILSNNKGRYLRIKMEIKADGDGLHTPLISGIQIIYEKNLVPSAPQFFHASGEDSSVTLSWTQTSEQDIKGYLIYYGSKKGTYFGTESPEGASPLILTGKENSTITIHGLNNGQLYHFAIAAYDGAGIEYPGELSTEITCRPVSSGNN